MYCILNYAFYALLWLLWKKFLTKVEYKCTLYKYLKTAVFRNSDTLCLQGFKYLYLTPVDFKKVSAMNSVHAELIEDEGEPRYKIIDVIGEILIHRSLDILYYYKELGPRTAKLALLLVKNYETWNCLIFVM